MSRNWLKPNPRRIALMGLLSMAVWAWVAGYVLSTSGLTWAALLAFAWVAGSAWLAWPYFVIVLRSWNGDRG